MKYLYNNSKFTKEDMVKGCQSPLTYFLDCASCDFGRPRWHLLKMLRVSASYRGLRIVYLYDDDHEDFIVSDELQIEYYE